MCRWLAYAGPPLHLDSLIVRPENSLVGQSRGAQETKSAINADGFGIGWYGSREHTGLERRQHGFESRWKYKLFQ
jgi:predicted glutamine amidotransferase